MANRPSLIQVGVIGAAALGSIAAGRLAANTSELRLAVAAISLPLIVGAGFKAPRLLLLVLVFWLTALGMFRRVVSLDVGSSHTDILLLIGPVALSVLVVVGAQKGAFRRPTGLSRPVLALSILAFLSAFNPLQGGLSAGLGGLLFVLVPMLAFWIGRSICDDDTLRAVLLLIATLALGTAFYGLVQVFAGFPSWDVNWILNSGYTSLHIHGVFRPFASFSAATEFAHYTAVALIVWIGLSLRRERFLIAMPTIVLLLVVLVYESSRSTVVLLMVALGLMLASRRGFRFVPAIAAGLVLVAVLVLGLHFLAPSAPGSSLVAHQVQGLANPLNSQSSTASGHASRIINGILSVKSRPLGSGVGAVSIAGKTLGGINAGTEYDPGNVPVALGIPGLIAYLLVLVRGMRLAYRTAVRRRDFLSLVALGLLSVTAFQWLNGGEYAVAFLPWLVLGWLDARSLESGPSPAGGAQAAP